MMGLARDYEGKLHLDPWGRVFEDPLEEVQRPLEDMPLPTCDDMVTAVTDAGRKAVLDWYRAHKGGEMEQLTCNSAHPFWRWVCTLQRGHTDEHRTQGTKWANKMAEPEIESLEDKFGAPSELRGPRCKAQHPSEPWRCGIGEGHSGPHTAGFCRDWPQAVTKTVGEPVPPPHYPVQSPLAVMGAEVRERQVFALAERLFDGARNLSWGDREEWLRHRQRTIEYAFDDAHAFCEFINRENPNENDSVREPGDDEAASGGDGV